MRVFTTKRFARFARQEGLTAGKLIASVKELENGLHDGDLGGGLIKKRISRAGGGKRDGYRVIIAIRLQEKAIFVYGFAKSASANLDGLELIAYKRLASVLLGFSDADIKRAIAAGELREMNTI